MAINWFPGHMNKAKREIKKAMRKVDVVIEVLDARLPDSSENPLVAQLRGDTPVIKVLNRQDLADPAVTAAWLVHLRETPGVVALAHDRSKVDQARKLVARARRLLPAERSAHRTVTAMIVGVPNVGKSTLINTMAGRNIARTSNKPAVTKTQQQVRVASDFVLLDTPGFLWPKLSPPACGYRLAVSGAIADTAVDYLDMALFAVGWLLDDYPQALRDRYGLVDLPADLDPWPATQSGFGPTNLEALTDAGGAAKRPMLMFGGGARDASVCARGASSTTRRCRSCSSARSARATWAA